MRRGLPPRPIGRRLAPLFVACCASAVSAQPPSAPTREQVEQVRPPPETQPRGRLTVEGGVERAPCALDRPDYQNIRFTLADVTFDDLKGLAPDAMRPAFAPYVGQEHPVAILCEIRDRAATILREAGYIAAVEVPEQRIEGGRVHFTVLMARLVGSGCAARRAVRSGQRSRYLEKLTSRGCSTRFEGRTPFAARRRPAGLR